eukprot:scaffold3717_cov124-Isochrysis_galbana.AAC.5
MSQLASACQCGDTKCGGGGGAGERGRGIEVKQARCGGSAHTGSLVRAWTIGVSTLSMYELSLGTDPKSANSPLVFDSAAASQSTKVGQERLLAVRANDEPRVIELGCVCGMAVKEDSDRVCTRLPRVGGIERGNGGCVRARPGLPQEECVRRKRVGDSRNVPGLH